MADRLYPMLHQLLSSREPAALTEQRWALVGQRLRDLVAERMNLRRGSVQKLLQDEQGASIQRQLVFTLALAAGPGGVDRLRASLEDPTP
jgi:predicted component of type VI protein secretion system